MPTDRISSATANSPKTRSQGALDWLNFFLADVQTGVGPFLAIYLTATRHWNPAQVGQAVAVQGIATVVAQSPAGALADATGKNRGLLAAGVLLVAVGSVATLHAPGVVPVFISLAVLGLAGAVLPITVAAITLAVVKQKQLAARIGRNEAFNHTGNVAFTVLAGAIGTYISQVSISMRSRSCRCPHLVASAERYTKRQEGATMNAAMAGIIRKMRNKRTDATY